MRPTIVVTVLVAVLALAPAAVAKGPNASVASGPQGIEPGKPWVTELTFVEYTSRDAKAARPVVVLRSGSTRFAVRPRRISVYAPGQPDMLAEARYRLRVVFPRAGRWTYTVHDGTRDNERFRFPPAQIGGGAARVETGYVEFPVDSRAHSEGGGGAIVSEADAPSGESGGALPPEVVLPPEDGDEDGGGVALWIPLVGLTLAGVGTVTALRRRRG
jgi:hypothetical protein